MSPRDRGRAARAIAMALGSAAFVVLIAGVTYFAILVLAARFGSEPARAEGFHTLSLYLNGGLAWYQDARVYGAASLLLALASFLFGVHPLARISLVVSGLIYLNFLVFGDTLRHVLAEWASRS